MKRTTSKVFMPRAGARVLNALIALARDDRGQALTEYILILGATLTGAVVLSRNILRIFDKGILYLGGQLEKDLKTGRAPLGSWKN